MVYAKMGSNIAVAARAEFSPNSLLSHVAKGGITLVLDDVDAPNEGNNPSSGVDRFGIAPPKDINELVHRTLNCASVGYRFAPICNNVGCGPNANIHLPLPVAKDAINVLRLGLKKPIAK